MSYDPSDEPVFIPSTDVGATLLPAWDDPEFAADAVADYERRRAHWWGRFLLWLLRKTT